MAEFSEVSVKSENERNIEQYTAAAASVVGNRVDGLSPGRQEVYRRLTYAQKATLILSTLAFLVAVGCSTPKPVVPEQNLNSVPISLEDKQKYQEILPVDIVPEEELAEKYHTRIWNTPDVKLSIRRAALEKEPIFKFLQNMYLPGVDIEFNIVLLDGYKAHPAFLTKEQKAGLPKLAERMRETGIYRTREQLEKFYEENKEQVIKEHKLLLTAWENELSQGRISQDKFNVEKQSLDERYKPYIEGPNEENIIASGGLNPLAMYLQPKLETVTKRDEKSGFIGVENKMRMYVLLSTKEAPKKVFISGDEKKVVGFGTQEGINLNRSFPNPNNYPRSLSVLAFLGQDYVVDSRDIGFILRHEFSHYSRGASEKKADLSALKGLYEAYEAFLKGDDSLYYFVFQTPQGNIFTKHRAKAKQDTHLTS